MNLFKKLFNNTPDTTSASNPPGRQQPLCHIDHPDLLKGRDNNRDFLVQGWIAAQTEAERIELTDEYKKKLPGLNIQFETRPDVEPALDIPGLKAIGFKAQWPWQAVSALHHIDIEYTVNGEANLITIPVSEAQPPSTYNKQQKLEQIIRVLACPYCQSHLVRSAITPSLDCQQCNNTYPISDSAINFLADNKQQSYQPSTTELVSDNAYDSTIISIINRYHDGLILDCGAGLRHHYYANVVNFEIVDYPSTDVLGLGEQLPFANESFDAVFSCAVLEHVRDPFTCANEIKRVLKPGGTLYCQLPFLQPYHPYPSHFYNMSHEGAINLFEDKINIHTVQPLNFGQPISALSWILQSYHDGLPEQQQERLLSMTVRDFLKPTNALLFDSIVTHLNDEAKLQLACCNYLLGHKK